MKSFTKIASFIGLVLASHRFLYAALAGCHGVACLTTHHAIYAVMALFYALLAIYAHQNPQAAARLGKTLKNHLQHGWKELKVWK